MSELAFDKSGNPFKFNKRTTRLRVRRFRHPGRRGTCETVLDAHGEQLFVEPDADILEFRGAVGNVPGLYRVDQCDDAGTPIEDAPPGYVSIESPRNAAMTDGDPRDFIIRDLAQINADVSRTIAERFSSVMQAAAEILRAADGAGLPHRAPLPPAPRHDDDNDDQDGDNEEDEEDDDTPEPTERVWSMIEQMLPSIQLWLASMAAKRVPSTAVSPPPAQAPPSAPPPAEPVAGPIGADASSSATAPTAPIATATAASSAPPAAVVDPFAAAPHGVAGVAEAPRNAVLFADPTPEQWCHLFAIRACLTAREAAIAEQVITKMTAAMRAQWLGELSALGVAEAAEVVRSMIPPAPAKPSRVGKSGGG